MITREEVFAEERLGRLSLIAFVLALSFAPTWMALMTGILFVTDLVSILRGWHSIDWRKRK